MDTSATMDSLNDTPLPPELSFDDLLLDDSPVKKSSISNIMNDPLDFDEDEKRGPPGDETLHTPGSKKTKPPPVPVALAVATTTATETTISMASTTATATTTKYERPMIQPTETSAKTATTTTHPLVASATVNSPKLTTATGVTPTPTVLLNNRNILPKTAAVAAAAAANKIIKITPKSTTTATIPQGTTATATSVASLAGKAVKTSNGQIYYIQKKASVLPAVRLQQVGTTTATGTSATTTAITTGQSIATVTAASTAGAAAKTTTSVTTNTNSNKTVAIQVIRAADGSLMPVKGTAATTLAVAAAATGKKIISNVGGQVLIKTPLRTVAGITSSAAAGDATGKTVKLQRIADSSSNIVPVTKTGGKIIVHSASGKQIVVSNQNLIKLSPKPTLTQQQTIGQTAGAASVTAGAASVSANGKMLQLSGKPLQYVRVFPNSKLTNNANANAAATSTTTTAIANSSATATTTSNTTATTATSKPAIRILNPLPPQKFTVVRPNAATKLVLTQSQSPKKEGGVTFSPVTSKVQKTIVTLPTQQRIVDDDKSSPTNTPISSSGSSSNNNSRQSLIRHSNNINSNNNSAPATYTSLIRKPNISEINSEIKRITSTPASVNEHHGRSSSGNGSGIGSPTEIKRNVNGNNIVVVSRSSNLPPLQPRSSLNSMVQGTLTNTYSNSNSNQQPKKLYSVLKNNNTSSTSSSFVTALSANSIGERKSLLISVQEQALLSQQHHKSVQLKRQLQSSPSASSSLLHSSGGNSNSNQANANYNSKTASSSSATSNSNKFIPMKIKEEPIDSNDMKPLPTDDGVLRRKHCNCSKSQCLKLYCDCFANGEFCQDCTCKDCFNNLQYEDERQRAIKNCLERNPSAFKPKITTSRDSGDMRLHNKGCNCKRSGCLKNYCECYEAKIPCSSNCKCVGCRNIEERPDLDMDPIDPKILATIANASGGAAPQVGLKRSYDKANSKMGGAAGVSDKMLKEAAKAYTFNNNDFISGSGSSTSITGSNSTTTVGHGHGGAIGGPPPEKQQCNFITQEVVDATIQCMLSQADECDKNGLPAYQTEKMVMEEMGRCLVEIIDFSIRNTDTSFSQE